MYMTKIQYFRKMKCFLSVEFLSVKHILAFPITKRVKALHIRIYGQKVYN